MLQAVEAMAGLSHDETLAVWARALIAVGDMIVDAGEPERS